MFACYQAGYDRQDLAPLLGDNVRFLKPVQASSSVPERLCCLLVGVIQPFLPDLVKQAVGLQQSADPHTGLCHAERHPTLL
jgi:hypothetical protein